MELSPEDSLRLNVMLANQPLAIRIDESRMVVYALSKKGEMEISLNPNCRDDQYLKQIREMFSMHVLGSPSGYPQHIWSRMGHLRNENLGDLLLLGEPEAAVAVAYSEELTDELAHKVWWALEDAENARQMLRVPAVVHGKMGPQLAAYLVEFLPFETEAEKIMDTIRLVLQPGLLDAGVVQDLWKRGKRKNAFYVGFLMSLPDNLPGEFVENPHYQELSAALKELIQTGNAIAALLLRVFSSSGQIWLHTLKQVLEKPGNQDVVNWALDIAADYFAAARPEGKADATLEELKAEAYSWMEDERNQQVRQLLAVAPQLENYVQTLRLLSGSGYGVVRPVFSKSDAIGTLMRRKLQPILMPYLESVSSLMR
jgi:hypothetical protein